MPGEETPATPATPAPVATPATPAPVSTVTPQQSDDMLLQDVKDENARIAKEKADADKPADPPAPKPETPKPEAKDDKKAEGDDKDGKKPDDEEPEFTDPKLKAQRDWNLKQVEKIAADKKAIEDEKTAIQAEKDKLAAEKAELAKGKKPEDEEKPPAPKATELGLKNYKDVADVDISDPEDGVMYKESAAIREAQRGLAKDVSELIEVVKAQAAEIEILKGKSEVADRLSQAEMQQAGMMARDAANEASAALTEEFGELGLIEVFGGAIDPVNIIAATIKLKEFFIESGKIKASDVLTSAAMVRMWKFANEEDISKIPAKGKKEDTPPPKDDKKTPAPPLPTGGGKPPAPTDEKNLSPEDQMLLDYKRTMAQKA